MFCVDIFCPSSFCTDLLVDDSSHLRCVQEWDRKEGTAAAYLTQDMGDGCPFWCVESRWWRWLGWCCCPKSNFYRINALHLYLHLADFDGKHWQIYHTWILWVNISGLITCHTVDGRNPTPPDMYKTLQTMRCLPYQSVQDSEPFRSTVCSNQIFQRIFFLLKIEPCSTFWHICNEVKTATQKVEQQISKSLGTGTLSFDTVASLSSEEGLELLGMALYASCFMLNFGSTSSSWFSTDFYPKNFPLEASQLDLSLKTVWATLKDGY